MNDAQRELLDWAIIGGGVLDVPLARAADEPLLALIAAGFLKAADQQPDPSVIRYAVTDAGLATSIAETKSTEGDP